MGVVSRNEDVVARTKLALAFALDPQSCRAGKEQDPLVMCLPIRLIRRSGLPHGDDALDPHTVARKQFREDFLVAASRKVIEKIDQEPISELSARLVDAI